MSDKFYEATRVAVDGRLMKRFRGVRPKGQSSRVRLDQDVKVVETIVRMTSEGAQALEIAEVLDVSPSSIHKIKREFREQL